MTGSFESESVYFYYLILVLVRQVLFYDNINC